MFKQLRRVFDPAIWTRNLIMFAVVMFLMRFGSGLLNGARMNFFVETFDLAEGQVLFLESFRELPGLGLILIAAVTMRMSLPHQAALALFLEGVGFMLYAFIGSYTGLLAVAVIASFGFHMWTPLHKAIGMSLSNKENTGQILGVISSISSVAALTGMGALALITRIVSEMDLRFYYIAGGAVIIISSVVMMFLPKDIGATERKRDRIVVKKKYWLYYVLIFFSGARKLVLGSFITLMLVKKYNMQVEDMALLTFVSSLFNIVLAPRLGALIDKLGERTTQLTTYSLLAVFCFGYAFIGNLYVLVGIWLAIKLVAPLGLGIDTYVYRNAPPEELAPTLTAGVTFDHISSVSMPFIANALLPAIDYQGIFFISAILILISLPFARQLQVRSVHTKEAELATT